jgi:hypothetical protein
MSRGGCIPHATCLPAGNYTEMVYQPMIELLAYLKRNGFKTYIVSASGIDFGILDTGAVRRPGRGSRLGTSSANRDL